MMVDQESSVMHESRIVDEAVVVVDWGRSRWVEAKRSKVDQAIPQAVQRSKRKNVHQNYQDK